jgi:hypothetical protein
VPWHARFQRCHQSPTLRVDSILRLGTAHTRPRPLSDRRQPDSLSAIPLLTPPDVEHRVSFRIKRQGILYGDEPTPLTAIIHEAALRMGISGPAVDRAQLQHLIDMSELDNITIVVIPFGKGSLHCSGQPISYYGGLVPQLDTVELDTDLGSELIGSEAHLATYRSVMDRFESYALKPTASRDLIHEIAQNM